MDELNTLIQDLQAAFGDSRTPVLSLYADINPARPENAGLAWVGRIKNALKELPEFREGKRDPSLYEQILALLEQERPSARTLVLFASRDPDGKLVLRRIDLQVELPVVDLAHGRVEARWGEPYLTPLIFAFDEYERAGVVHLSGARWHFYELFLGELREDTEIFANISADEWRELQELADRIENVVAERRARSGGTFDKLSPKEREAAKVSLWMHKLYVRLAHALDKAVDRLGIERLVLMGEAWQVSHFEGYLNRGLRNRIVARVGHPTNFHAPTPQDILERVLPVLEAAERRVGADSGAARSLGGGRGAGRSPTGPGGNSRPALEAGDYHLALPRRLGGGNPGDGPAPLPRAATGGAAGSGLVAGPRFWRQAGVCPWRGRGPLAPRVSRSSRAVALVEAATQIGPGNSPAGSQGEKLG